MRGRFWSPMERTLRRYLPSAREADSADSRQPSMAEILTMPVMPKRNRRGDPDEKEAAPPARYFR